MNFLKRAVTSIARRPGKTVILLLLVFILGTVIAGAISVGGAINNTDANLRARMQPIVAIEFDDQAFNDSIDWDNHDFDNDPNPWDNQPQITPTQVRALADLPYVAFHDFMIQYSLRSFDLERYWGDQHPWNDEGRPTDVPLRGTTSTDMIQFETGIMELVQGSQFDATHMLPGGTNSHALVSQQWANANNLSVGSTFTLSDFVMEPREQDWGGTQFQPWNPEDFNYLFGSADMTFTIVGLFDRPENEDEDSWTRVDALNTIFVPNWAIEESVNQLVQLIHQAFDASDLELDESTAQQLEWISERGMRIMSFFIVNDPANIEAFRAAAEPILPEFHNVQDMSNSFSDIESSMATMQGIADVVLWVSIGATLLILSLLITLLLRDRRYEMGVYLALGEKKSKIMSQILLEVVVTSFVGITLAIFSGHFISSAMSNNMLMNELQAAQAPSNDFGGGMWRWDIWQQIGIPNNDMTIPEMAEAFQVTLGADTILLFYGVGLGAVVLSTLIPVIYVVTLKPKKVLM